MLGEVLRNLRESRGLSSKDLAAEVGITYSALGKYERNEREADYKTLIAIADYFNVSVDFLLDRKNPVALNQRKVEFGNEIIKLLVSRGFANKEEEISNDLVFWTVNILAKALDMINIKS